MSTWDFIWNFVLMVSVAIMIFLFGAATQAQYDRKYITSLVDCQSKYETCAEYLGHYLNDTEHCLSICNEQIEKFGC